MKKTALISLLFVACLAGCGRVDSVDTDVKPFEIEKTTTAATDAAQTTMPNGVYLQLGTATTADPSMTTTATLKVNLVKRSSIPGGNVTTPARNTVKTPARVTVAPPATRPTTPTKPPTKTTAAPQTTAPPATTQASPAKMPDPVVRDNYRSAITANGVEIKRDGEVLQTIHIDTSKILAAYADGKEHSTSNIFMNDFDFDGHYDIFIPQDVDDYNTMGIFMRYNPETDSFEEWQGMSEIKNYAWTDDMDGTISTTSKKNALEYSNMTYEWSDGNLVLIHAERQYRLDDASGNANYYIDYFTFSDGTDTLVKREKVNFDGDGNVTGSTEISIDWTMRW